MTVFRTSKRLQFSYFFLTFFAPPPKKLDMDFIPDLSTFDRNFCAAVNLEPLCNTTKTEHPKIAKKKKKKGRAYETQLHLLYLKFSKWNELLRIKLPPYKGYKTDVLTYWE